MSGIRNFFLFNKENTWYKSMLYKKASSFLANLQIASIIIFLKKIYCRLYPHALISL